MQNALGIGGSMAAGLMAAQEGAMIKRLHAGRAAEGGVYAAERADSDVGRDEVQRKFAGNVRGLLSDADRDRVVELVEIMDTAAPVRELYDILANRVRTTGD